MNPAARSMKSLSDEERERVKALGDQIMAAPHPANALFHQIQALNPSSDIPVTRALFESLFFKIPRQHYWTLRKMADIYDLMGEELASMLMNSLAIAYEPQDDSILPYQKLFRYFDEEGSQHDALEIFDRQVKATPEHLHLKEERIARLAAKAGLPRPASLTPPVASPAELGLRIPVEPSEMTEPLGGRRFGHGLPLELEPFQVAQMRPAIEVHALIDAELFIFGDAIAVRSRNGAFLRELSICRFPKAVGDKVIDLEQEAGAVEQIECDSAVIISDPVAAPNLCHFLLDQMSRLDIYWRANGETRDATVIGPAIKLEFQRALLEAFGVKDYLGTGRVAHIRVKRLWVSSNCLQQFCHPAHWGARWAIGFIQQNCFPRETPSRSGRRIYISREEGYAAGRRVFNRAETETLLAARDFEAVVLGAMPFAEQVRLFQEASHVVGVHGAGLTNIVFCRPGTQVLEIFHPALASPAYAVTAQSVGLDYSLLVGSDSDFDDAPLNDPASNVRKNHLQAVRDVFVDLGELRRWLDESGCIGPIGATASIDSGV
jgi:capsular polysaccharide biosynthesis protein